MGTPCFTGRFLKTTTVCEKVRLKDRRSKDVNAKDDRPSLRAILEEATVWKR